MGHSFGGYTSLSLAGAFIDTDATQEICDTYGGWLCEHIDTIVEEQGAGTYDQSDDRVKATIPMTPAGVSTLYTGLPYVEVPTLIWAGSKDTSTTVDGVSI